MFKNFADNLKYLPIGFRIKIAFAIIFRIGIDEKIELKTQKSQA
jgi:hypothetical protein